MKDVELVIKSNKKVSKDIYLMRLEGDTSEVKNVSGLHDWIVANKKDFQNFLFQNHYFKTLYLYKKAFKNNDWDTMHEIMLEFWESETE